MIGFGEDRKTTLRYMGHTMNTSSRYCVFCKYADAVYLQSSISLELFISAVETKKQKQDQKMLEIHQDISYFAPTHVISENNKYAPRAASNYCQYTNPLINFTNE